MRRSRCCAGLTLKPVITGEAKQSMKQREEWIASSLRSSQRRPLFLIPPTFVGSRRAKLALGWREAPGGGAAHINARNTSPAAPTPTRHIVRSAHDAPPSPRRRGRDKDRRSGGTVCNDVTHNSHTQASLSPATTPTPPQSRRVIRASFDRRKAHLKFRRAQGMPGARCARSLACKNKKHTS